MQKEKKTRRSNTEYPELDPKLHLKTRIDQMDYDYVDKLPETWTDPKTGKVYNPKQYLNDFTKEYVSTSFDEDTKKRIHKIKKVQNPKNKNIRELKTKLNEVFKNINELLSDSKASVKTKNSLRKMVKRMKAHFKKVLNKEITTIKDFYKKEAEDRNNTRNSCILTRTRAQGKTVGEEYLPEYYTDRNGGTEDAMIELIDHLNDLKKLQDDGSDGSQDS